MTFRRQSSFILIAFLTLFAGCSSSGESDSTQAEESTGNTPAQSGEMNPCDILTQELVVSIFNPSENAEFNSRPSLKLPQPICTVSWEVPQTEEEANEMGKKMQEYMMAKMKGEDVSMPSFNNAKSVSLTVNKTVYDDEESAASAFQSMLDTLRRGISSSTEYKGKEYSSTFQADYGREVEGVGNQAAWSTKLSQLSVQTGQRIFHVTVQVSDQADENLGYAEEVARKVVDALQ